MYCMDCRSQLAPLLQHRMQHCPRRGSLGSGSCWWRSPQRPLLPLLRRHKHNSNTISKEHLCNLLPQRLRVFLYLLQPSLLSFFWRWCLFISACLEIFCNTRPHNNAYLLRACDRAAYKGCTVCRLHYSRRIKSITVSQMSPKMTAFILL